MSDNELKKIIDQSLDIICTIDQDGRFIWLNAAAFRLLGYTPAELVGRPYMELVCEEDRPKTVEAATAIMAGVQMTNFENRYTRKDGSLVPIVWSATWQPAENIMYCVARDATEKKQAEEQIQLSEKRFKALVQDGSDLVGILDPEANYLYVSPTCETVLGILPEELIGRNALQFIHEEDRETVFATFQTLQSERRVQVEPFRFQHRNGSWRWIETILTNLIHDPAVQGIVANSRDITERVLSENKIRISEEKYRMIFTQTPLPKWIFDPVSLRVLDVNQAAIRHYGFSREEFLALSLTDFTVLADDTTPVREVSGLVTHRRKDGGQIQVELTSSTIQYNDVLCLLTVGHDVTEKMQLVALERLEREIMELSLSRAVSVSALIDQYLLGIEAILPPILTSVLWLQDWTIADISAPSLPKTYADALHGMRLSPDAGTCGKAAFTRQRVVVADIATDPLWEPYRDLALSHGLRACWSQPIIDSQGRVLATFANYYTTPYEPTLKELEIFRKSASLIGIILENYFKSKALLLSNERYDYVNKATNDAIYDWDLLEEALVWGQGYTRLFGHPIGDKPENLEQWIQHLHPDDAPGTLQGLEEFLANSGQERWQAQYRYRKADGQYAYVAEKGYAIRNERGEAIRMIGVLSDISYQKQEEQRLQLLESVILNTNDSVLITEAEPMEEPGHRILYVNEAFTRMTGYQPEEVIGRSPRMLQGTKTDKDLLLPLKEALSRWEPSETTVINYKKSGEPFWVHFSVSPVADETGWYTHWIAIQRDVTRQKNEELQKQFLAQISRMFNQGKKLIPTLEDVLQHLAGFVESDLAELWVISADKQRLNLLSGYGLAGATQVGDDPEARSVQKGEGLVGTVWNTLTIQNWAGQPAQQRAAWPTGQRAGMQAGLGVPLLHHQELVGVLVLGTAQPGPARDFHQGLFRELETYLGSELKRKQLEEDLNQIFSTAPDVICIAGMDGFFKRINPAACTLLEYSEEELLAKSFIDLIHPDDRHCHRKEVSRLPDGKITEYFENRYITKSGRIVWLAWTSTPVPEEGLIYAVAKDVTEQKNLQGLLDSATELARIGSWEIDLVNRSVYWSPVIRQICEVDPSFRPQREDCFRFFRPDVQGQVLAHASEAAANGTTWDYELPIITAKGEERWIRSIGQAEFREGRCIRLYGSFQDIHQRKTAELALQKAYEEKKTILESIGDAFFAVDRDWIVTYWNNRAEAILGTPKEAILGKNLWESYNESHELEFYPYYHQAVQTGQMVTFEAFYAPVDKWLEVSAYPLESGLSVYFKDVSNRRLAEERLRQSNERFKKVTEAAQDAIWDWDIVNNVVFSGEGYKTLFGHEVEEDAHSLESWGVHVHPEDRDNLFSHLFAALESAHATNWQHEYRYCRADGTYAYVIDRGVVIRDKEGRAIRMVGAMADITHRKEYEESLSGLNQALEQHARELALSNAELEQFAYVASHDLQEPLRMVTSFLTQLSRKYDNALDEKAQQYIHFAVDGAKRMRQIILDLLDYSRVGKHADELEAIPLQGIVEDVCHLQRRLIEESRATIEAATLPCVRSFRSPLLQVFQNLIGNALKYRREGVPPFIRIESEDRGTDWLLTVQDNGIGIDPEYFDKIFIIFQRLHSREQYSGTGMGLAIVKKIIENLGGRIWVDSTPGYGSAFYFTLPKERGSTEPKTAALAALTPTTAS